MNSGSTRDGSARDEYRAAVEQQRVDEAQQAEEEQAQQARQEIPGGSRQEVITLILSAVMIIGLVLCTFLWM
jgi:hypothetical protein